ncbi:MAG: PorP/SprF family type IX secretion system membrane protein [Bacteroidetes bacterium]|nr:PorP/SprF family type IX secretion system membrane protein [Bacteroidota bacterium]
MKIKQTKKLTAMKLLKCVILSAITLVFAQQGAKAQFEPQFTQYMFNEMFINPAYAGSREQISATMVYRNQWVGLEGAPKTQTASIHGPLMNKKLGLGLTIMNESIE